MSLKGWIDHRRMVIEMLDAKLATLSQVREFMAGTADVPFRVLDSRAERYALVQRLLARLGWTRLRRADKTLLKAFLAKLTGLSRAQLTRLIGQHVRTGVVRGRLSGTREYLPRALRRHRRDRIDKTRSDPSTIAIRRAPQPDGRAGFIRIDTVHQGDSDGAKGVHLSMPWTASRNGSSPPAASASARLTCYRSSACCSSNSPS